MTRTEGASDLDRERLVWMYTQMVRVREFEEHPGVIRGPTHLPNEDKIVGAVRQVPGSAPAPAAVS